MTYESIPSIEDFENALSIDFDKDFKEWNEEFEEITMAEFMTEFEVVIRRYAHELLLEKNELTDDLPDIDEYLHYLPISPDFIKLDKEGFDDLVKKIMFRPDTYQRTKQLDWQKHYSEEN